MTSRLIIECGSSKSDWVLISDHGLLTKKALGGFNPHNNDIADLSQMLKGFLSDFHIKKPDTILMYGAGITDDFKVPVTQLIRSVLNEAEVQVYSDIFASAHATMGEEEGWVAILGTGSNLAFFRRGKLHYNHSGLGWLLGDEGSGRAIIKSILRSYCRYRYSVALTQLIEKTIGLSPEAVVSSIYSTDSPLSCLDKLMAQLSVLFGHPEIKSTCEAEIARFLDIVINLQERESGPVHFTGSVANAYEKMIRTYLQDYGVSCGRVVRFPIDQIVKKYAKSNQ